MSTQSNFITNLSNLARRDATRRRPWARTALALATLLALLALAQPGHTLAQGGWPLVGGTVTVINDGPGDQLHPHISGTLVAYSSVNQGNAEVRYHDLLTGADTGIPTGGAQASLPLGHVTHRGCQKVHNYILQHTRSGRSVAQVSLVFQTPTHPVDSAFRGR